MDLVEATRIILRHWRVVAPVIVVSLVLAIVASGTIDPEYQTRATMLLRAPANTVVEQTDGTRTLETSNPYLGFPSSLNIVAQVLEVRLRRPDFVGQLARDGFSTDYDVRVQTRSPIISIEVTSRDREVAARTAARIMTLLADDLASRQDAAGAPRSQLITGEIINPGEFAIPVGDGRNRVRAAILVGGVLLSAAAAFAREAFARKFRFDTMVAGSRRGADDRAGNAPPGDITDQNGGDPTAPSPGFAAEREDTRSPGSGPVGEPERPVPSERAIEKHSHAAAVIREASDRGLSDQSRPEHPSTVDRVEAHDSELEAGFRQP